MTPLIYLVVVAIFIYIFLMGQSSWHRDGIVGMKFTSFFLCLNFPARSKPSPFDIRFTFLGKLHTLLFTLPQILRYFFIPQYHTVISTKFSSRF